MPVLTVVVEQLLAPVPGGTGRYAEQLTTALAAEPRPGWRVRTVTAWHRDMGAARIPGVDGPHRLPAGRRALSELWSHGAPPLVLGDRVHASTPLAPRRRHGLAVTVHDAVPWTHPETLTPRGVAWHRRMVLRAVRRADAIVVPSTAVADDLAGLFPAAAGRLHVVGHGVTPLPVPADAGPRRRRLALPDRYVLAVATLEPRKGLNTLTRALALAPTAGLDLAVVGPPGWGGIDLGTLAAAAGLVPGRVRALGRLDDADMAAVLAGATVLAAPSLAEGFGLPVLEAMAAGIPVVVSDAPALVELVGSAGLVVPRADARELAAGIAAIADDAALADDLARRGIRRSADYSWSAAADRIWRLHTGR